MKELQDLERVYSKTAHVGRKWKRTLDPILLLQLEGLIRELNSKAALLAARLDIYYHQLLMVLEYRENRFQDFLRFTEPSCLHESRLH